MAPPKSVAIRIGTEGKAQVKSDFAEVRQSGESAFKGIGDAAREMTAANENQFNRLAKGYDAAVAEMEAADRRRAATADKLNAIIPRTAMQSTIDASVGSGYGSYAGSARESAAALRELLALEDAQQAKASALPVRVPPSVATACWLMRSLPCPASACAISCPITTASESRSPVMGRSPVKTTTLPPGRQNAFASLLSTTVNRQA